MKKFLIVPIDERVRISNSGIELHSDTGISVSLESFFEFGLIGGRIFEDMVVHGSGDSRLEEPCRGVGHIIIGRYGNILSGIEEP